MTAREVVVLGVTGSIGRQAVDVAMANPDRFRIVAIAAGGDRPGELADQALALGVDAVAVARAGAVEDVTLALYAAARSRGYERGEFAMPKVLAGPQAVAELAEWPCDVVLNAVTGSIGLAPTLAALRAGRRLALANKESLVAGGDLVTAAAEAGQILPVDSEHSALLQCLVGGAATDVRRLVLTASGGPFRGRRRAELEDVTVEQALAHPTWSMGPVVTCNSATLVNKGLEVIEAHHLFAVPYERIDVVVHPQSIVHSMVEWVDGSTLAQAGRPDMRVPIALALSWPERVADVTTPLDWTSASAWEFAPLDDEVFPAVQLARSAGSRGGAAPAVYNAANEQCVAAFLDGRLPFLAIVDTVAAVLDRYDGPPLRDVDDVLAAESWARATADAMIAEVAR